MCAKWGVTEWRNRSVSRREETRGWLGQRRHDPAASATDCPQCHGDGQLPNGRYCQCNDGLALAIHVASQAAHIPHDHKDAA